MATKGWVFVLFVIATEVANTSAPGSPAEHVCTDGLRHAGDDGHGTFIFKGDFPGFAGRHWNPPSLGSMERLQLSMDQQKNSLSAVGGILDKLTPKDCGEIYRNSKGGMDSGIYTIYPRSSDSGNNSAPLRVFCRVEAGQAWTVIQRRQDGSVDFYHRTWGDYSRGFGDLRREFWLGNDNIHVLTNQDRYKLYIAFEQFDGGSYYSDYACFRVESEQAKYKLRVGPHNGTAGPHLWYQKGSVFYIEHSVCRGKNNPEASCYLVKMGGFWRRRCDTLNPNGFYWRKVEDCPKRSRYKTRGILGAKFIEMRISEPDNTTLSVQSYDEYCK